MIQKMKTWYKHYNIHGSARAYLTLRLETDNIEYRDKVAKAIQKALYDDPEITEKQSSIGFSHD
jgi:hypothetical protein